MTGPTGPTPCGPTPCGPATAGQPAGGLAREICRRIGANPAGPVAARLTAACAALAATATAVPEAGAARDELVARLIDGATNRETYFFRDRRQLAALAGLLAGSAAPLTLWSAGCATGEEPYSLAILMLEAGLTGMVVGTDVSRAALAQARNARYRTGPMSPCREVTDQDAAFLPPAPATNGERTVAAAVRAMVRLAEHNILTGPPAPGRFDAVVCRNVLVHMDGASRTAALTVLAAALRPGGALLLGPGDVAPPADPADHGLRPLFRNGAALHIKADPPIKGGSR